MMMKMDCIGEVCGREINRVTASGCAWGVIRKRSHEVKHRTTPVHTLAVAHGAAGGRNAFLRLDSTPTWNVRYELHAYVRCFLAGSTIGPAAGACGAGT